METKVEVFCHSRTINLSNDFKHLFIVSKQMYDDFTDSLEGDMSIPTARKNTTQPGAPNFNTLDEPIKDTIVCRQ